MITSQNVSGHKLSIFFNFIETLCSNLKIFKFLYFKQQSHDLPKLWYYDAEVFSIYMKQGAFLNIPFESQHFHQTWPIDRYNFLNSLEDWG